MVTPVRITDSLHTRDNAADDGRMVDTCVPEYSTCCPWNLDGSLLLLIHKSYFALYSDRGTYIKDLPFEVNASSQPRWSRRERRMLYFLSGNSVKRCNAATGEIALVHQFREYFGINGFGEADISDDGNYLVLCGDGTNVFTYAIGSPPIGTGAALTGIESLALTPANNVLVSYHTNGSARFQGVELFDKNLQFIRQVLQYNCHKDLMRDADGEEILIHDNQNDPTPPTWGASAIVSTRLSDGIQKRITHSSWALALHVSCPVNTDFFFVDRYDKTNMIQGDILKVWLDGRVETLCLHGSKAFPPENKYTWQPKVSCSRDGSKVVYASNMGIGTPTNYSDVWLVDLVP